MLLSGSAVLSQNPTFRKQSPYDPIADFAHVALFSDSARVLIARKDFPPNNFKEFIAYVKANQDTLQYGSAGAGSGCHTCAILLDGAMGTKITHVPYRGAGPAMQDLIGGRIDYMAEQISTAMPQIKSGTVKAYATFGLERGPGLEDLPTAEELGVKGLDCGAWGSFSFPKGTPRAIVERLAKASSDAIDTPAVIERFKSIGVRGHAKDRAVAGVPDQVRQIRDRALDRADQGQRRQPRLNNSILKRMQEQRMTMTRMALAAAAALVGLTDDRAARRIGRRGRSR